MLSDLKEVPTIQVNGVSVRIEVDPLSARAEAMAVAELRESPAIKAKAVEELRTLMKGW